MSLSKKKIYIFGCTMWDIVGKPLEPISKGKDCSGFINERPGGVAFNVAIGLSKILNRRSFELNLVSAIGKNEKTSVIRTVLEQNNINTKYLLIKGNQNDQYLSIETKNGEIFGSINSSTTFLSSQSAILKYFSKICLEHKNENSNAIFIFDGNCSRKFLDFVKKEGKPRSLLLKWSLCVKRHYSINCLPDQRSIKCLKQSEKLLRERCSLKTLRC